MFWDCMDNLFNCWLFVCKNVPGGKEGLCFVVPLDDDDDDDVVVGVDLSEGGVVAGIVAGMDILRSLLEAAAELCAA